MKNQLLLVDGYNMIGSWPELVKLKKQDLLEDARDLLIHELANYAKYEGITIEVVFDAQLVPGVQHSFSSSKITVTFTSKDETADEYIERQTALRNNRLTQVTVATSDLAEQWTVFSKGALRISANELYKSIKKAKKNLAKDAEDYYYENYRRNSPWDFQQLKQLEKWRDQMEE